MSFSVHLSDVVILCFLWTPEYCHSLEGIYNFEEAQLGRNIAEDTVKDSMNVSFLVIL